MPPQQDSQEPSEVRDHDDPGDQTLRNFRYQHGYGVILLVAATRGEVAYVSIWCEHHEDFLAERRDGLYDAYQIKTATPEDGAWVWTDEQLRDSIKRFVRLHRKFPGRIAAFYFVSNVEWFDSHAIRELGRSPYRLLEAISGVMSESQQATFNHLCTHCDCDEADLRYVLERLKFQKGPGRDSFDDEIAHSHLSPLDGCRSMSAAQRNRCLDALIEVVHRASALVVRDPARHWCAVNGEDGADPHLRSKRILVSVVQDVLSEMATCPFNYAATTRPLSLDNSGSVMSVLQQKLVRGGLAEYVDLVRDRAISAERHLIELAHLKPDEIDMILNQITLVVRGECDEARLEVAGQARPYGPAMLADVHRRLRKIAQERPEMVYREPYEVLAGVAGMLTEDCRVWWSEQFELEGAA